MVANKKKLEQYLPDKLTRPDLQRGRGVHLTTHTDQEVQQSQKPTNIETQESKYVGTEKPTNTETQQDNIVETQQSIRLETNSVKVKRRQPGWELRVDLIKSIQRLSIDQDRYNYEIVEEALIEYLQKHNRI